MNEKFILHGNKDFILKLIQSVEKRPCVWNPTDEDYSKRDKLEKAWKEISHEVGKEEATCKDKWRNVRTGFLRSLKGNSLKKKKFYLHDEMCFLLLALQKNESNDNIYEFENIEEIGQHPDYSEEESIHPSDGQVLDKNKDKDWEIKNNNIPATVSVSRKTARICSNLKDRQPEHEEAAHNRQKRKLFRKSKNFDFDIMKFLKEIKQDTKTKSREETTLMCFFKGITSDVLSLSAENQRLFKKKLVDIVYDLHKQEGKP